MSHSNAVDRANMPAGTNRILDQRTLQRDNQNLLKWLKRGLSVLDVGCGSGAITKGMADMVGPAGKLTGIDPSDNLISLARSNFGATTNLHFEVANINTYAPAEKYDLISSARVLQWLDNPQEVLARMANLLKPGGCLSILDYNHEKIEWLPEPPATMKKFYQAFLQWRKDVGFDNAIADHLKEMFEKLELAQIAIEERHETTMKGEPDFQQRASIWSEVALHRGPQLVNDGYITEEERQDAYFDYNAWVKNECQSMRMYLLATEGLKG
jgi:ubiquinone/menaquinone biosynthesis C-methylase UbiE